MSAGLLMSALAWQLGCSNAVLSWRGLHAFCALLHKRMAGLL